MACKGCTQQQSKRLHSTAQFSWTNLFCLQNFAFNRKILVLITCSISFSPAGWTIKPTWTNLFFSRKFCFHRPNILLVTCNICFSLAGWPIKPTWALLRVPRIRQTALCTGKARQLHGTGPTNKDNDDSLFKFVLFLHAACRKSSWGAMGTDALNPTGRHRHGCLILIFFPFFFYKNGGCVWSAVLVVKWLINQTTLRTVLYYSIQLVHWSALAHDHGQLARLTYIPLSITSRWDRRALPKRHKLAMHAREHEQIRSFQKREKKKFNTPHLPLRSLAATYMRTSNQVLGRLPITKLNESSPERVHVPAGWSSSSSSLILLLLFPQRKPPSSISDQAPMPTLHKKNGLMPTTPLPVQENAVFLKKKKLEGRETLLQSTKPTQGPRSEGRTHPCLPGKI